MEKFQQHKKTSYTRDVFYVLRMVDLMKTAKINVYIMYIFEDLAFIYTCNLKLFQNALCTRPRGKDIPIYRTLEYGRNMTFKELVSDRTLVTIA